MENRLAHTSTKPGALAEGPGRGLPQRLYEFIFEVAAQLLAAQSLEDQVSVLLDTVTAGLGYAGAAVALIDKRGGTLRMRGAAGFADDEAAARLELPLDSNAPQVKVVHDGRPAWITRDGGDDEGRAFLKHLGAGADIFALPLFGAQLPRERRDADLALGPGEDGQLWSPHSLCVGALYVGARREETEDEQADLLARFAERVGGVLSSTAQTERLGATVRKLQRERQWVESIMKSVADPIVLTNLDNEILLQNRRAEELFSDRRDASEGKRRALEMNDLLFSAYLSSAAVASEEIVGRDLTLVDPLEGSDIHFEVISTPALNARGERIGLVSIFRDVTDLRRANEELARNFVKLQQTEAEARRERERRRVEQQLFESEKLAAVGRLAASIAHEVNNPLEAIKNSLYLLSTGKKLEQNQRFLDVARKETERVSHIIRQMLGFARRTGEVEWASVNQLIEETLILVEKKMRQARVEVVREFDPGLPQIRARADQLRQVFLNLLLNAQQSMEKGGRITIVTSLYEQALQPTISVQISDTGRGIPEADLSRIFEPFFSTRTKGTGLGLWVTQDIVRHHGGRIEVTSEEGAGTTFNVILPVDSPTLSETDAGQQS